MPEYTLTDDQMDATYGVTAIYSNRFVVSTTASGLRIAFGEQYNEEYRPHYRTAVFLAPYDAVELLTVLENMLSTVREKMQQEQRETNAAEQERASANVSGK